MAFDLENIVKTSLDSQFLETSVNSQLGWVSCENNDFLVGSKYLIAFNYPTDIDDIEYIAQFIRSAPRETIRRFYRSCNGMRMFGDGFVVPGVGFTPNDCSGLDFYNLPYNIETMGGLVLPAHAPVQGFSIGQSLMAYTSEEILYDIVDDSGTIVCGCFDDSPDIQHSFKEFEPWIEARVTQAQQRYLLYKDSIIRSSD